MCDIQNQTLTNYYEKFKLCAQFTTKIKEVRETPKGKKRTEKRNKQ